MAQLNGLISKLTGSAGQFTFKRRAGRTIVSEKATTTTNPRTPAQQKHRMKWPNLIRMYAGISPLLNAAFENRPRRLSDYNMFVKMNFQASDVYLTRQEAAAGACVAAPYIITLGTLPSVRWTGSFGQARTDIALGTLALTRETTVREFSNAVVAGNADYNYGDQIAFITVEQQVNETTGNPECRFEGHSVVLDKSSDTHLYELVGSEGFSARQNCLAASLPDSFQGGYAWVHSRKDDSITRLSSQALSVRSDIYEAYSGEAAYRRAVATYGGEKDNFLTPSDTKSPTRTASPSAPTTAYAVALTASPSGAGTLSGAGTYQAGAEVTISATVASGYTFTKWSDGKTDNPRTLTVDSDIILTALFTAGETTGGGSGSGEQGPETGI